jgi:hypothetical protein
LAYTQEVIDLFFLMLAASLLVALVMRSLPTVSKNPLPLALFSWSELRKRYEWCWIASGVLFIVWGAYRAATLSEAGSAPVEVDVVYWKIHVLTLSLPVLGFSIILLFYRAIVVFLLITLMLYFSCYGFTLKTLIAL